MGVQERLPTVILMISLNDFPSSLPVMFSVVPPSVGPLTGEILAIIVRIQPQGTVIKLVEHAAEIGTQVLSHHPQIPSDTQS